MTGKLNPLACVYIFKIAATVAFWCVPLLLFPQYLLTSVGLPEQSTYLFVRLLGWAYLALCVGYFIGLKAALKGKTILSTVYVGIVSNGGGCLLLLHYALNGEWSQWGCWLVFIGWSSIVATFFITLGLYFFGIKAKRASR